MNILTIAWYTAIRYFRNVIALCFFVLSPILFVYFMGIMVGSTAPATPAKEKAVFFSEDVGKAGAALGSLLHSKDLSDIIELTDCSSREDGIRKVEDGKADAFVYIGRDFSSNAEAGKKAEIDIYQKNKSSAVMAIADNFANSANAYSSVVKLGGTPSPAEVSDALDVQELDLKEKTASNKDMASISCLLIFIFYGSLLGSSSIINELKKKTFIRLQCAPLSPFADFAGKLLGNVAFMLVCTLVSSLAASFIFGVNLAGNLLWMLLALIIFLVIVNSLGILLAGSTKNIYLCGLFAFALNYFLVYPITANAFSPATGSVFDISRTISPHYYTYQAVMGSIYPGAGDPAGSVGVLALMALLLCGASWLVKRRVRI